MYVDITHSLTVSVCVDFRLVLKGDKLAQIKVHAIGDRPCDSMMRWERHFAFVVSSPKTVTPGSSLEKYQIPVQGLSTTYLASASQNWQVIKDKEVWEAGLLKVSKQLLNAMSYPECNLTPEKGHLGNIGEIWIKCGLLLI